MCRKGELFCGFNQLVTLFYHAIQCDKIRNFIQLYLCMEYTLIQDFAPKNPAPPTGHPGRAQ